MKTIRTFAHLFLGAALVSVTLQAQAAKTGIAPCDEYYAAVTACLPQMCGVERALVEAEMSFHEEVLLKTIELKGRAAAADACSQDLQKEIEADPYGCYESHRAKAGLPKRSIQDVSIRPAATAVTISFKLGAQPSTNEGPEVEIASEDLQNEVRYRLAAANGTFTLNTAVDHPTGSSESAPSVLAPESSYCFAITAPDGQERRGTFTTTSR